MVEKVELYLNKKYEKGLLYEEDVNEIQKMYSELQIYTHRDIFDNRKLQYIKTKIRKKSQEENTYVYGVLEPFNNKIIKVINIDKEHVRKEEVCIDFLIEIYFQKLSKIYINNENIIIPKIYKYGYINSDKYILYFLEMEYFKKDIICENESIIINKEIKELIQKTEINNKKLNIVFKLMLLYKEGLKYLNYIENKYSIYHNDTHICSFMINGFIEEMKKYKIVDSEYNERFNKLLYRYNRNNNFIINTWKCIIIDFEKCYRKKID
jgi:hypothetical protein